jgi:hypothetical protein
MADDQPGERWVLNGVEPIDATSELSVPGYGPLEFVARGGSSVVYRSRRLADGTEVAIKVLNYDGKSLERELIALSRLSNAPHVLDLLDHGHLPDGRAWIATLFAPLGTAQRLLDAGPLPPDVVVRMGCQAAEALHAAHAAGMVHCDVKPSNLLIDGSGAVQVSDFGIARLDPAATGPATMSMTLLYSAPEVLEGRTPTPQSDVYSLGLTMIALLNGAAPFAAEAGGGIAPLVDRICAGPVPSPPSGTPEWLVATLERCTQLHPEDRFESCAQLQQTLERQMAPRRSRRSKRVPAMVVLGVSLLGLAATGAAYLQTETGAQLSQVDAERLWLSERPLTCAVVSGQLEMTPGVTSIPTDQTVDGTIEMSSCEGAVSEQIVRVRGVARQVTDVGLREGVGLGDLDCGVSFVGGEAVCVARVMQGGEKSSELLLTYDMLELRSARGEVRLRVPDSSPIERLAVVPSQTFTLIDDFSPVPSAAPPTTGVADPADGGAGYRAITCRDVSGNLEMSPGVTPVPADQEVSGTIEMSSCEGVVSEQSVRLSGTLRQVSSDSLANVVPLGNLGCRVSSGAGGGFRCHAVLEAVGPGSGERPELRLWYEMLDGRGGSNGEVRLQVTVTVGPSLKMFPVVPGQEFYLTDR